VTSPSSCVMGLGEFHPLLELDGKSSIPISGTAGSGGFCGGVPRLKRCCRTAEAERAAACTGRISLDSLETCQGTSKHSKWMVRDTLIPGVN